MLPQKSKQKLGLSICHQDDTDNNAASFDANCFNLGVWLVVPFCPFLPLASQRRDLGDHGPVLKRKLRFPWHQISWVSD